MKASINLFGSLLLSLVMSGQAFGAGLDWLNSPSLRAWQDAVRLAGVPAQKVQLPPWVDSMAISTISPMAHKLVLEGLTHVFLCEDVIAYEKFRMALRLDPNCLMAHCGVLMCFSGCDSDYLLSVEASYKAIAKLVQSPMCIPKEKAYAELAFSSVQNEANSKATVFYAKKIFEEWKRDPYATIIYASLLQVQSGEPEGAEERNCQAKVIIDKLLEQHPESVAGLFSSAYLESSDEQISDATFAKAEKLVALHTESTSCYQLLGHFQFRRGDYIKASQSFQKAEKLALQYEKRFRIPRARNLAWFKAISYRAVAEFCAGHYDTADKLAAKVVQVRVEGKYPKAVGSLFQMWEGRTLQLRLLLAQPQLPNQVLILKANPAPLPKECSTSPQLVQSLCHAYQTAFYEKKRGNAFAPLTQFDKMEEVVMQLYHATDLSTLYDQVHLERILQFVGIYEAEVRALSFPDSAELWLSEAIANQQYDKFLYPPLVPYPLEWKLAQHYLITKQYQKAIDACTQGLKRFPNHAGVLATMEKAQSLLKKQPQT